MKRTLPAALFSILTLFYLGSSAKAEEDSAFGNLSSEENNLRTVFGLENQDLSSYLDVKQSYINLNELYERSFGTRKEELALQLVARAQDVLVSKTGAVLNYSKNLSTEVGKTNRLSESEVTTLSDAAAGFETTALEFETEINAKTTTAELVALSEIYNNNFFDLLSLIRFATIQLSVARGEYLVGQMQGEGDLIQSHMSASSNAGGDVASIQEVFNEGMLDLEEAKTKYQEINDALNKEEEEGAEKDFESLLNKTISANKKVSSGHGSLKNVLSSLEALYSQSPWQLNENGE